MVTLGLGVLACRHAHETKPRAGGGDTRPPTRTGGTDGGADPHAGTGDPAAPDPTVTPNAARIGPMRRAAPFVFVPHPGSAQLERLAKSLRAVALGPTASLRVEAGCEGGARIVDNGKSQRLPIGKERTTVAVVDPSSSWIAVELAGARVAVFARADLRRLGTWDGAQPLALGSDLLAIRHDCRWVAIDPSKPKDAPRVLGESCGDVIHVDAPGRRFAIAEPIAETTGVRAIVRLGDTGAAVRHELPTDPPLGSAVLSSDGRILCGVMAGAGKPTLHCRALEGGAFERVAQGVAGPLRFAADAPRLAFAIAGATAAEGFDLHVADFEQRFIRKLGKVHQHRFEFLPGGERLVAYEGGRGVVFQLDTGFVVPFGDREDDWVGVVPLPGKQDSFLATRLRNRCADLVRIQLPAD
jgi:hypothetical protein